MLENVGAASIYLMLEEFGCIRKIEKGRYHSVPCSRKCTILIYVRLSYRSLMSQSPENRVEGDLLQGLIPQKSPFIMVDTLAEYTEKCVVSYLHIKCDNILVAENHFTGARAY